MTALPRRRGTGCKNVRKQVTENITEYAMTVKVGNSPYNLLDIHRVNETKTPQSADMGNLRETTIT